MYIDNSCCELDTLAKKRVTFYSIMLLSRAQNPQGIDIEHALAWCETRDKSPAGQQKWSKIEKEH